MSANNSGILSKDDIFAGVSLLIYGIVTVSVYSVILVVMWQLKKEAIGFFFLFSQGIADVLLLLQFAVYPGFMILSKTEFLSANFPRTVHILSDYIWFAMVYHYILIAWTRLAAIKFPIWFRQLGLKTAFLLCFLAHICGLIHSIVSHLFPWFVIFVFDKNSYGMTCVDWPKYSTGGTAVYYLVSNFTLMLIPMPVHMTTLILLYRQSKARNEVKRQRSSWTASNSGSIQLTAEKRLIIPCIINSCIFVLGQIMINIGIGHGKWIGYHMMLIFATNSAVNPFLYLAFSKILRQQMKKMCVSV